MSNIRRDIRTTIIIVSIITFIFFNFLTILWFSVSSFLIAIIFMQLPKESAGLSSFPSGTKLLNSPSSSQRFLKLLTFLCILIYFGIAVQMNLMST